MTHTEPGADPAAIGLALAVASALHAPIGRAPEMAPTAPTRRTSRPARTRRRTARG
ncbi:hypothetical protein [Streptomyces sp. WAC04114]|uniref:hypothetical protein n=1 Tax=Streptomyces sp. WAC04114 TaxID=2867961 RepID=UPI001C8CB957|nr:hypothetical protein [Streptomyces sp. WAC04114]MBX9364271.1 hypothetical protein [Streptomyces sp. WAC04114]